MGQLSFFDEENRMAKISKLGDPLERLDKVIDWKKFIPTLNKAMKKEKKETGRPHYSYMMMYADSAYWLKEIEKLLPELCECQVHEKGSHYVKLTELQQFSNRIKSKIRARVEHVFGFMTNSMHGLTLKSIGLAKAKFNVALTNLVYNMCRYETITRYAA